MALSSQQELNLNSLEDQLKSTLKSWMSFQRPVFTMMTEINGRIFDQAIRMNGAWINFISRQIEHEIDATRRLMGCHNVNDLIVTCQTVMKNVQRETHSELGELARVNNEFANEALEAVRAGVREAVSELRH